jgi:AAA domain-containing protein
LVDEKCRHHSLVWIAGPPGAGKTSLIASYLSEHKQRTLWYHIDPGDADLATFFHYLAQVAQTAAGRKSLHLPALTPESMANVSGFTRRFMRELWSKVPLPAVLVLDNYQELPIEPEVPMKKTPAKKVATAGKQVVQTGKTLRGKAGATARQLKKTVADAASTSSRRLKKNIKTAKSSPASRQARKVGEAVGTFLGQAIGRAERIVTRVVKKK